MFDPAAAAAVAAAAVPAALNTAFSAAAEALSISTALSAFSWLEAAISSICCSSPSMEKSLSTYADADVTEAAASDAASFSRFASDSVPAVSADKDDTASVTAALSTSGSASALAAVIVVTTGFSDPALSSCCSFVSSSAEPG